MSSWVCWQPPAVVQDIRFAEKRTPTLPQQNAKTQLTLMFAGQPETGRTTTGRNLFAALAKDENFQLTDVSSLTWDDFKKDPRQFSTQVKCHDSHQQLQVTYEIIVRPSELASMWNCLNVEH